METLGKPFPTKRNQLGWPGVGGGGTRTEDGTSRATNVQLGRGAQELAESGEAGRGPTLTEDMASGSEKRAAGQGHLICIVLEKETEQCTKFWVARPRFLCYCFTEVSACAGPQPSRPQRGGLHRLRCPLQPRVEWTESPSHPHFRGAQRAGGPMCPKSRLHSDKRQLPRPPSPGLGLP